ncbi:MAG: hypothetical protein QOF02_746 [Blastocatellia bacterium]|jgi:hypothetical protein|nr:hypothetical protein [Blastocatellia bacterium]
MEDMHDMGGHHDHPPEEPPHNMMVIGEKTVFLSHLPMFMTPHNFQVILEATFSSGGKDVTPIYTKDRQTHAQEKMYTLEPQDRFKLPTLFTPRPPERATFKGTIFRGHLERGGVVIGGLEDIDVNVKRVVYAQKLDSSLMKLDKLEYLLVGKGKELFLAHVISKAPDFDQLLSVRIANAPSDADLNTGVRVTFQDRQNTASQRIKEKEKVTGQGHVTGAHQFLELQIQADVERYFEEGELGKRGGTMSPTPEEIKSGFGE